MKTLTAVIKPKPKLVVQIKQVVQVKKPLALPDLLTIYQLAKL